MWIAIRAIKWGLFLLSLAWLTYVVYAEWIIYEVISGLEALNRRNGIATSPHVSTNSETLMWLAQNAALVGIPILATGIFLLVRWPEKSMSKIRPLADRRSG